MPDTAEAFLRRFHAAHPGVTTAAYARGRGPDGRSSYQHLADAVATATRVLDLGCGDGYLLERLARGAHVGVDLSAAELAAARARPSLHGTLLIEGRAQSLPFANAAFDACVSHLAFTLMDDPDVVAREVARVLRPGGTFATLVGGGPAVGEGANAFDVFLDLLATMPSSPRTPRLGDPRVRSPDSLAALLGAAGLTLHTCDRVVVDLSGTLDEVWSTLSTLYELDGLDAATLARLRDRLAAAFPSADVIPCAMATYLAIVMRPR